MRVEFPDDADGEALRRVAQHSDMSKPMKIDFAVVVPDESSGREIARRAAELGYVTSLEPYEARRAWTCICTKTMLATYDGVIARQEELERLSAPLGGYTDGWGTLGN